MTTYRGRVNRTDSGFFFGVLHVPRRIILWQNTDERSIHLSVVFIRFAVVVLCFSQISDLHSYREDLRVVHVEKGRPGFSGREDAI